MRWTSFVTGAAVGLTVLASLSVFSCAAGSGAEDGAGAGGGGAADAGGSGGSGGSGATAGSGGSSGSSGSGGSAGSGDDGGWPGADYGEPCSDNSDCKSQQCSNISQGTLHLVCTQPCTDGAACPTGSYCAFLPGAGYSCVPDQNTQCGVCTDDASCGAVGDLCVVSPKGDRFCARDCSFAEDCPSGFSCVTPEAYGATPPTGTDPGATRERKLCVPDGGESCACTEARNGATRVCSQTSGGITCGGTETCNGTSGTWEGCTASTPQAEQCDGADNDCDGVVDNGDPATLCGELGNPSNASWACTSGTCLPECSAGFVRYPAALPPEAGCPCEVGEPTSNDTCASATSAGSVAESAAQPLTLTGRLSGDTDVDWYRFDTVDDGPTTGGNGYHVKIRFVTNPNDEFIFDVIRGGTCADPDAAHSSLVEYTWCVDGTGSPTRGQGACSATGTPGCQSQSSTYLVRVKRKPGVAGSCARYMLEAYAHKPSGAADCDFSSATGQCDVHPN